MKSLWKTILAGLIYKDLAWRRQLSIHRVITGLVILLAAGGITWFNRYMLMSSGQATPVSVSFITQDTQAIETDQPSSIQNESAPSIGYPIDPANWSLTPTYLSKNYNVIQPAVIQPACVYQGLEKTIAWALAIWQGYSRAEATQQLGFIEMPMRQVKTGMTPANARGLAGAPVSFVPLEPNFTEWRLDANCEGAVTYALRGCFRTSTVAGNRVEIWGGNYPVICVVVEDAENTHIVYSLNGHTYTSSATPLRSFLRSFLLFGYLSDGYWVWIETKDEPKMEITDHKANANERLTVATLYDSQPWDAEWLMNSHHMGMQPLPDDWQAMTDENEKQAILKALSASQDEATP